MTFTETWFGHMSCMALRVLARKVRFLEGRVIEIGSWEGRSTCSLASWFFPATVHAVDTWEGSPGEVSEQLARERDVYATFQANIARLTKGNVVAHRMDWRDYFTKDDSPVRFCFIDAEHTYENVRANIEAVLPLMVPGGILCGDDVHHVPIQRAVVDTVGGAFSNASVWWREI